VVDSLPGSPLRVPSVTGARHHRGCRGAAVGSNSEYLCFGWRRYRPQIAVLHGRTMRSQVTGRPTARCREQCRTSIEPILGQDDGRGRFVCLCCRQTAVQESSDREWERLLKQLNDSQLAPLSTFRFLLSAFCRKSQKAPLLTHRFTVAIPLAPQFPASLFLDSPSRADPPLFARRPPPASRRPSPPPPPQPSNRTPIPRPSSIRPRLGPPDVTLRFLPSSITTPPGALVR
jgi:hypothetical protein